MYKSTIHRKAAEGSTMTKLEEITDVNGVVSGQPVTITAVYWCGSNVIEIIYKTAAFV